MAEFGVGAWVRVKESGAIHETRGQLGQIVERDDMDPLPEAWTVKFLERVSVRFTHEWEDDLELLDVPPALDQVSIETWLTDA